MVRASVALLAFSAFPAPHAGASWAGAALFEQVVATQHAASVLPGAPDPREMSQALLHVMSGKVAESVLPSHIPLTSAAQHVSVAAIGLIAGRGIAI